MRKFLSSFVNVDKYMIGYTYSNQTGQITQNARGAGGSPVNVNFTVNAIDTRGFQEALVQNRGVISNIINDAVNERGAKNLI